MGRLSVTKISPALVLPVALAAILFSVAGYLMAKGTESGPRQAEGTGPDAREFVTVKDERFVLAGRSTGSPAPISGRE